jgi:hypothetical protein
MPVCIRIAHELLVQRARFRPAPFTLSVFGALDGVLDGGRFNRL